MFPVVVVGKSLGYVLPALLEGRGASLVVSPLISLMKDQRDQLARRGIHSVAINSSLSKRGRDAIMRDLGRGVLPGGARVLFMTPEQLTYPSGRQVMLPALEKLEQEGQLSLVAIDEAHCVTSWGVSFRPSYRGLGVLRERLRSPVLACTATCPADMEGDILESLGIPRAVTFRAPFDKKNIHYSMREVPDGDGRLSPQQMGEVVGVLGRHSAGGELASGLVFAQTKAECWDASRILRDLGYRTGPYYSNVSYQLDPSAPLPGGKATSNAMTTEDLRAHLAATRPGLLTGAEPFFYPPLRGKKRSRAKSKTKPEAKVKPEPKAKPKGKSTAKSKAKAETTPKAKSKVKAEADLKAGSLCARLSGDPLSVQNTVASEGDLGMDLCPVGGTPKRQRTSTPARPSSALTAASATADNDPGEDIPVGMSRVKLKKRLQNDWAEKELDFMVATIAFGMGVDKGSTRWVAHLSLPASVENFYQETGRCGRDGGAASSYLLYSRRSVGMFGWMQGQSYSSAAENIDMCRALRQGRMSQAEADKKNSRGNRKFKVRVIGEPMERLLYERAVLRRDLALTYFRELLALIDRHECRRKLILGHFGERPPPNDRCCDVCDGTAARPSFSLVRALESSVSVYPRGSGSLRAQPPVVWVVDKRAAVQRVMARIDVEVRAGRGQDLNEGERSDDSITEEEPSSEE